MFIFGKRYCNIRFSIYSRIRKEEVMKTPYEVRAKYGINRMLFGKAKKKSRVFYWVLFIVYMIVAMIISI